MTVHFIGAGPGAADLITVRGLRLIERCPVCLYAGSLVPREIVAAAPPGARIVDTAPLTLDEIIAEIAAADAQSLDIARVHSGDPSLYGATAEQMRRLEGLAIPFDVTPGVPAFAAAAASLGRELTYQGGADRDPDAHRDASAMPAGEASTASRRRGDAGDPPVDRQPRAGRPRVSAIAAGHPAVVAYRSAVDEGS
jgi:precorrin-4/cobalt-precorrin-4 C11-methyltransferase